MDSKRVKFIADTACDIPDEAAAEYFIDLPSVPIVVDGMEYLERKSFNIKEFYPILAASSEIPKTSRVPLDSFLTCYEKAYNEGYPEIICVTINAGGSGTNASATAAREAFFRKFPEAGDKTRIHIVDSRTYSAAYGHPVIEAAKMARAGKEIGEILDYLEDYFSRAEIYLGCYTLDYAKKSGRITAAAAFVGDVLGLRPIVLMKDGWTKILERVRGDRNLVGRIAEVCKNPEVDFSDAVVICGCDEERGREMLAKIKKDYGVNAALYTAGASIIINSGPNVIALVVRRKKNGRNSNA